jgi:hypothetical protein
MPLNHLSPRRGIFVTVDRVSSVTWIVTLAITMRKPSKLSVNCLASLILNPWIFLQKVMHPNYSKDSLISGSSLINVKFLGLDPVLLLLRMPLLMFWEVSIVQHVFVLHVMDLAWDQVLHMILVTLVMSLQVMYSGSHKDFFPEKSDYCLLPKKKNFKMSSQDAYITGYENPSFSQETQT